MSIHTLGAYALAFVAAGFLSITAAHVLRTLVGSRRPDRSRRTTTNH